MAKLKLSPPWVLFYEKVKTFFQKDPDITIYFDEEEARLILYVENGRKAEALGRLLPLEKEYGNVTLTIDVIPANDTFGTLPKNNEAIIKNLFANNEAVKEITTIQGVMSNPITYVVFAKEVVQYFTDDIGDRYGICSTLYQELAKEIFEEVEGVFYCTDKYSEHSSLTISTLNKGGISLA